MTVRNFALGLAAVVLAAAPAAAQTTVQRSVQASLNIGGPLDWDQSTGADHPGLGVFKPGATLDAAVTFYLDGSTSTTQTLRFPDPADAVDFWIADADGWYVGWFPGAAASGSLSVTANQGADVTAKWDQTDWYGSPLPAGIYSIEATVNLAAPKDLPKVFFQIGRQPTASASSFAASELVSATTVRPGMWVESRLRVYNLTSRVQTLKMAAPWLPINLTFLVRDASNREIFRWSAPYPMIAIFGPTWQYIDAYDSRDYGPVVWPSVDDQGKPLAAGTYRLVAKLNSTPAGSEHVRTVRLAGAPCPAGNIQLPQGTNTTPVRTGGAATYPVRGSVYNGAPVAILYEGVYWDQIQGTDATTGAMITGWVRKTAVVKR